MRARFSLLPPVISQYEPRRGLREIRKNNPLTPVLHGVLLRLVHRWLEAVLAGVAAHVRSAPSRLFSCPKSFSGIKITPASRLEMAVLM